MVHHVEEAAVAVAEGGVVEVAVAMKEVLAEEGLVAVEADLV